jgi:hypothetical protein
MESMKQLKFDSPYALFGAMEIHQSSTIGFDHGTHLKGRSHLQKIDAIE